LISFPLPAQKWGEREAFAARPGITVQSHGTSLLPRRFNPATNRSPRVMVIGVSHLQPVVALVAGILILLVPRLLNYIVALYLIFIGIMGLGIIR
jgi:hypothetical protein